MKFTPGIMAVSKASLPAWVPMAGAAIDLDFVNQRYYWGGAEKTTGDFATYTLNGSTFDANGLTPSGTIDVTVSLSGLGTFETDCTWGISAFNTAAPGANKSVFQLDNGSNTDRTFLQQTSTGVWQPYLYSGNVLQAGGNTAASALSVKHAAGVAYELDNTLMSANGITGVSSPDTACVMPVSITQLRVGRNNTVNTNPTLAIGQIVVFQTMKTQTELNALTLLMQTGLSTIDLSGQTRFGDMTIAGGVNSVFDGISNQASASCAQKSITNATNGYVGTRLPAAKKIGRVKVYGTNNNGFCVVTPNITLRVYGKSGSDPANSTDGTLLATETFLDTANESAGRVYNITDTNLYDRIWVWITQDTATTRICALAEIEIWELV